MSLWLCFSTSHPHSAHPYPARHVLCLPIGLPPSLHLSSRKSRCSFGHLILLSFSCFLSYSLSTSDDKPQGQEQAGKIEHYLSFLIRTT